jgi:hypothetical protein
VYRPLNSPIGPCRNLDSSATGIVPQEAPGTPVQRAAFRSRTLSPSSDLRVTGAVPENGPTAKMSTAEAVHRGLGRATGTGLTAPQRRELQRREPREPSLHHASSQHALQRGGAVPSTGSGESAGSRSGTAVPSSPQLQPRRLSHAQPASVSDAGRSPLTMSGLPAPRLSDEDRHSARCRTNEDLESQKSRRPNSDPVGVRSGNTATRDQTGGRPLPGRSQAVTMQQGSTASAPTALQGGAYCQPQSIIYMQSSIPSSPPSVSFSMRPVSYSTRPVL